MDKFHPGSYSIVKTGVSVTTEDSALSELIKKAENLCELNKSDFCGIPVLREGAKYDGVWLETQPMGGEMYACRDSDSKHNKYKNTDSDKNFSVFFFL